MSGRAAFHNPHTLVRTPYFQCSLVFFADRLFVTPLWLPGIDHFPVQVTVSPLSTYLVDCAVRGKSSASPQDNWCRARLFVPFQANFLTFILIVHFLEEINTVMRGVIYMAAGSSLFSWEPVCLPKFVFPLN